MPSEGLVCLHAAKKRTLLLNTSAPLVEVLHRLAHEPNWTKTYRAAHGDLLLVSTGAAVAAAGTTVTALLGRVLQG